MRGGGDFGGDIRDARRRKAELKAKADNRRSTARCPGGRIVLLAALIGLPLSCFAQEPDPLKRRIEEYETENSKLRQVIELQVQELLKLRDMVGTLEASDRRPAAGDSSQISLQSGKWRFTAGAVLFYIVSQGDALEYTFSAANAQGSLVGYEFAAGKDADSFGVTLYRGSYSFHTDYVADQDVKARSGDDVERTDIDVAWTHILTGDDRIAFGSAVGVKYLRTDNTIRRTEVNRAGRDEKTFTGDDEWKMVGAGLVLSGRPFENSPLSAFVMISGSLGMVDGMEVDVTDNTHDDANVTQSYRTGSRMAWGLNGSIGVQHPATSHGMIKLGYRGLVLNSTDGFQPYFSRTDFYDGHMSAFAALEVLF